MRRFLGPQTRRRTRHPEALRILFEFQEHGPGFKDARRCRRAGCEHRCHLVGEQFRQLKIVCSEVAKRSLPNLFWLVCLLHLEFEKRRACRRFLRHQEDRHSRHEHPSTLRADAWPRRRHRLTAKFPDGHLSYAALPAEKIALQSPTVDLSHDESRTDEAGNAIAPCQLRIKSRQATFSVGLAAAVFFRSAQ